MVFIERPETAEYRRLVAEINSMSLEEMVEYNKIEGPESRLFTDEIGDYFGQMMRRLRMEAAS